MPCDCDDLFCLFELPVEELPLGEYSARVSLRFAVLPLLVTVKVTVSHTFESLRAVSMSDFEETLVPFTAVIISPLINPAFSALEPLVTERT